MYNIWYVWYASYAEIDIMINPLVPWTKSEWFRDGMFEVPDLDSIKFQTKIHSKILIFIERQNCYPTPKNFLAH